MRLAGIVIREYVATMLACVSSRGGHGFGWYLVLLLLKSCVPAFQEKHQGEQQRERSQLLSCYAIFLSCENGRSASACCRKQAGSSMAPAPHRPSCSSIIGGCVEMRPVVAREAVCRRRRRAWRSDRPGIACSCERLVLTNSRSNEVASS